ncbi:MAG: hypothetical protein RI955_612, partial [Bacteroidota bacterium]
MKKHLLIYFAICIGCLVLNSPSFAQLPIGYGVSIASSTADEDIFNVTISGLAVSGTLNNTTTCGITGSSATVNGLPASSLNKYSNFTNLPSVGLSKNQPISGSVTIGTCNSSVFTSRFAVFIDYNLDGIFQTSERVYQSAAITPSVSGTAYPFTFTLPSTAVSGTTLMRIVCIESPSNISATGSYTWGETEDYAVNITNSVNAGSRDFHICGATTAIGIGGNPSVSGFSGAYSFSWSNASSLSGANTLNPVASPTTTTTYVLSVLDSTTMATYVDSITIFVNQPINVSIQVSSCNQYVFGNQTLTASGVYTDTVQTPLGCDSITTLHLTINNTVNSSISNTIYSGSSMLFNGAILTNSGVYYDTLTSYKNCDSIITLNLTVLSTTTPVGIVPNGYGISMATSTNDDEIFNVSLTSKNVQVLNNTSNCAITGSSAAINGLPASTLNGYSNFTNITPSNLEVNSTITGSVTLGFCGTYPYSSKFAVFIDYNRDGVFQTNEKVYQLPVGVHPALSGTAYSFTFTIPSNALAGLTLMRVVDIETTSNIAATGSYTWGETEDYLVRISNSVNAGMDKYICGATTSTTIGGSPSISGFVGSYSLVWSPSTSLNSATILNPIASPTATTTYVLSVLDSTTMISYADSVTIFVNQSSTTIIQQSACGSFVFNNKTLTASGTYYDTLINQNGCDSIITLQLVINLNKQSTITNTIYGGSSILFSGVNITTQGTYKDTIPTYAGCDSIITMNLIVLPVVSPSAGSVPSGYGISQASSTIDDEIYNVSLNCPNGGSLNNSSTCSITGSSAAINGLPASIVGEYSNFTNLTPTNLVVNKTVSGSVTIGFCNTVVYQTRFAIFIDYNRDGIFQSNENVYTLPSTVLPANTGTAYPFTFTIPANASPGLTLMRIVNSETSATITATSSYTWGETEDYLVNIGLSANAGTDQTICTSSSVTLNGTASGGTMPYTYNWQPATGLSATNIAHPIANVTANTTYVLTVTDSLGSVSSDTMMITTNALPTISLSGSFASCADTCLAITVGGSTLANWAWSISPAAISFNGAILNQTLCFSSSIPTSIISLYGVDANGCSTTAYDTVNRPSDCVWPGDANSDLVADNLDIFPIGLLNGTTGPVRNNASLIWIDQPATTFGTTASGFTVDAKHADCNGDGIIDGNDTTAILQNYGSTHLR